MVIRNWIARKKKSAICRIALFYISHAKRDYITTTFTTARHKLEQIQVAWFDHHRTSYIKLRIFTLHKTHCLLRHWFGLRKNKCKKWVRRFSVEMFGIVNC
jgi:hypothetical protein